MLISRNVQFGDRTILPILKSLSIHKPDGMPSIVLSRSETALVTPLRHFVRDFS